MKGGNKSNTAGTRIIAGQKVTVGEKTYFTGTFGIGVVLLEVIAFHNGRIVVEVPGEGFFALEEGDLASEIAIEKERAREALARLRDLVEGSDDLAAVRATADILTSARSRFSGVLAPRVEGGDKPPAGR